MGRDEFPPQDLHEPLHYSSIEEALRENPDINDGGASHYLHDHSAEHTKVASKPAIKQFSDKLYVGPEMDTDEPHFHDEHSSSAYLEGSTSRESGDTIRSENHRSRESGYSRTSENKDSQTRESNESQDSQTRGNDDSQTNGFSPDAPVVELHLGEIEKEKNPHGVSEDSSTVPANHQPVGQNRIFGSLADELKHRRLEKHLAGMRRNVRLMSQDISSSTDHEFLAPPNEKYDSSNRSRKNNRWFDSNDEKQKEQAAKAKYLVMEFKKLRKQLKDTYHSLSNGHA